MPGPAAHDILDAVRARLLGRAAVAVSASVVAATLLGGCRSSVGVAATVNGSKISESTVGDYVTEKGADPAFAAQAAQQGSQLPPPKSLVLQTLVLSKLYENTLAKHGIPATDGQLAAVHDAAIQQQFGASGSGRALDRTVTTDLGRLGIDPSFTPEVVRYSELFYYTIQRLQPQTATDLANLIRKAGAHVTVNPRYGTWDAAAQNIKSSGRAGLPDYLKLQPTPAAGGNQLAVPGR